MTYDVSDEIRNNLDCCGVGFLDKKNGCYVQNRLVFDIEEKFFKLILLPDDGLPVHCSSSYLTIIFCEGSASVNIDEQTIACFAGNVILLRNSCDFTVKSVNKGTVYLAFFKEELFKSLFFTEIADCPIIYDFFLLKNCKNEFLYFDSNMEMPIYYYAKNLQMALCQKDNMADKMVRCAMIMFLSSLHQVHTKNLVIIESSMMKDYMIGNILKYMADHCDTATLSNTAAHFNYNPTYFSALFHKKAYTCFSNKLLQIRLEQARKLLISTSMPIQLICEKVGFSEKSHFYRSFKASYGITPGQFRNKYKHRID